MAANNEGELITLMQEHVLRLQLADTKVQAAREALRAAELERSLVHIDIELSLTEHGRYEIVGGKIDNGRALRRLRCPTL